MKHKRSGRISLDGEWTVELIKDGFERFVKENGRLPTSHEVDDCSYLPTARLMQLKFGGLRRLRELLKYEVIDFGCGDSRSHTSARVVKRGLHAEQDLGKYLVAHFGEVFVHIEKRYGQGRHRVDFMVYSPDGTFGIDIFSTDSLRDMQVNLNVKLDKYVDFPKHVRLFLAVANDAFTQTEIDLYCKRMSKLNRVSSVKVVSLKNLYEALSVMRRFDDPLLYQSIAAA
jgi:hypothetical protein